MASTLRFYRETLDWLAGYHEQYGANSTHDLASNERSNAIWKLSGAAIAHGVALTELLERGYTAQTWPAMRAVHEVGRLLAAVTDPQEERIPRRWLADQEVRQAEARAAEQRQASRIAEQMRAAGEEPVTDDVERLTQQIYRGMSRAAHHRRSVVDESVDHDARTFMYGPDSRPDQRLAYTIYAGALLHEVLLLVGDALSTLWGPPFFRERLVPMLRRFEQALAGLDCYDSIRRSGLFS